MRKLIYGINISLDGCCEHTKFGGSNDVHNYFRKLLEQADLVIYGRKTYELMASEILTLGCIALRYEKLS